MQVYQRSLFDEVDLTDVSRPCPAPTAKDHVAWQYEDIPSNLDCYIDVGEFLYTIFCTGEIYISRAYYPPNDPTDVDYLLLQPQPEHWEYPEKVVKGYGRACGFRKMWLNRHREEFTMKSILRVVKPCCPGCGGDLRHVRFEENEDRFLCGKCETTLFTYHLPRPVGDLEFFVEEFVKAVEPQIGEIAEAFPSRRRTGRAVYFSRQAAYTFVAYLGHLVKDNLEKERVADNALGSEWVKLE